MKLENVTRKSSVVNENIQDDANVCPLDKAVEQDEISKEAMEKVMDDTRENADKNDVVAIKENKPIKVANRANLGALVEILKENDVKFNISRSLEEGYRYDVKVEEGVSLENVIDASKEEESSIEPKKRVRHNKDKKDLVKISNVTEDAKEPLEEEKAKLNNVQDISFADSISIEDIEANLDATEDSAIYKADIIVKDKGKKKLIGVLSLKRESPYDGATTTLEFEVKNNDYAFVKDCIEKITPEDFNERHSPRKSLKPYVKAINDCIKSHKGEKKEDMNKECKKTIKESKDDKFIIWSTDIGDIDDWRVGYQETRDLSDEEMSEVDEDKIYDFAYDLNNDYLDDEKNNLGNIRYNYPIIEFGYVGRWNGKSSGFDFIESGDVSDCLDSRAEDVTFYVTKDGEFCKDETHHDGSNHSTFRAITIGEDEFLDYVDEKGLDKALDEYSKKIGPDIAKVYGWNINEECKKSKKKPIKESKDDEPMVYMNTWANYNENGADLSQYGIDSIADGWLTIDEAIAFVEKYAEDEPFINDTDNFPFEVDEYSNAIDVLERVKDIIDRDYDMDIVKAIQECQGGDIEDAINTYDDGDYWFIPDVDNERDLAYEVIEQLGGLKEAVGDRVSFYIDREQMIKEYGWDTRDIMRDNASYYVADELGIDEDEVTDEQIEDWIDENEDEWTENMVDEDIAMAERGELDLSNYFDYEAFGRDLTFDGWCFVDNGAIQTY